jgi:hypothetical protein
MIQNKYPYLPIVVQQSNKDVTYVNADVDTYEDVIGENFSLFRNMIDHEIVGAKLKNVLQRVLDT